jgi:hypothetical protein
LRIFCIFPLSGPFSPDRRNSRIPAGKKRADCGGFFGARQIAAAVTRRRNRPDIKIMLICYLNNS